MAKVHNGLNITLALQIKITLVSLWTLITDEVIYQKYLANSPFKIYIDLDAHLLLTVGLHTNHINANKIEPTIKYDGEN